MKTSIIYNVNDECNIELTSGYTAHYEITVPTCSKESAVVVSSALGMFRDMVVKMWTACHERVATDNYDNYWDASRDIQNAETIFGWFANQVHQAVRFSLTISRECDNNFSGVNVYSISNIEYTFKDVILETIQRENAENNNI